jgi:hypothetical protein
MYLKRTCSNSKLKEIFDKNLRIFCTSFLMKPVPNFIKRKHPRKCEKKKQGARTKVQASKQPKRDGPQGGKGTTMY